MIELSPRDVENLKFGILLQACKDYAGVLMNQYNASRSCKLEELKRFFRSDWFNLLYDVDGGYVMALVEKSIEEAKRNGKSFVIKDNLEHN